MPPPYRHQIRVFTFVAQIEVLLVWILFSLAFWLIALLYGDEGLGVLEVLSGALFLIAIVPLVQYGFVILEFTARGHDTIPRMSADIFGMDARVLRVSLISLVLLTAFYLMPSDYRLVTVSLALVVTPAITSFIAFHAPVLESINPLNLFNFIRHMGLTYVALRLLANGIMLALLYFLVRGNEVFDSPLAALGMAAGGTYLLLTLFRGTGALLHIRHNELGIDTDFSREQAETLNRRWEEKEHRKAAIRASRLAVRRGQDAAWAWVEDFVSNSDFANRELLASKLEEHALNDLAARVRDLS